MPSLHSPRVSPTRAFHNQSNSIYNVLFKRNSVMVPAIFGAAFAFSLSFDTVTSKWWDNHNKGVSVELCLGGSGQVSAVLRKVMWLSGCR